MNSPQASQPRGDLAGKVALVTGATGGIGAPICQRIASDGGSLVITDLDIDECTRLAETLPGGLTRHLVVALQVEDEEQWAAAVSKVTEHFGELHILVNNAGIGSIADVEAETRETWDRLVAIDQTGVWLGMKHCGPLIERSGGGSIINMCSILGTVGGMGNSIAYHAAKGAVRTMTKSAALHWAASGVRVNSLHPGFIETPQLLERFAGSERHAAMLAGTPMGRLGRADEIAGAVAFLASDDSSFVTGSELYADGGWTAR
jgi:NAD(P)-dependent dehydrogenase (short-subunit alcohol dehydrogenase family)